MMYKNTDELKEAIKTHKLEQFEQEILNLAKPAIQILREKVDEDTIPIGASKLGGNPDVPGGFEWQYYEDKPLTFIGQFKLSELHPYDKENLLPATGILYFFYAVDSIIWGEAKHKGGWQVFYVEDENTPLVRIPHLQAEGEYTRIDKLPVHKIDYGATISLPPQFYENRFKDYALNLNTDNELDAYWQLSTQKQQMPKHHFLGYEDPIQGDVRWEVVVGSQDLKYQRDSETGQIYRLEEQKAYIESERDKWMLLFQIDTDDDLTVMWGDVGTLYICIQKQALQKRKFDECWTIMQCS